MWILWPRRDRGSPLQSDQSLSVGVRPTQGFSDGLGLTVTTCWRARVIEVGRRTNRAAGSAAALRRRSQLKPAADGGRCPRIPRLCRTGADHSARRRRRDGQSPGARAQPYPLRHQSARRNSVPLPPHSPNFNPIENAYAKFKSLLRKAAAKTVEALERPSPRPSTPFTRGMFQLLLRRRIGFSLIGNSSSSSYLVLSRRRPVQPWRSLEKQSKRFQIGVRSANSARAGVRPSSLNSRVSS